MARVLKAAALCLIVACGDFESRSVVLDLRVLAMTAEPPEVVAPIDLDAIVAPEDGEPVPLPDLSAVPDSEICAAIAEPDRDRSLRYRVRACWPTDSGRCDDEERVAVLLSGSDDDPDTLTPDPESGDAPPRLCVTLAPALAVTTILLDQLQAYQDDGEDPNQALTADVLTNGGNLDVQIELAVRGQDEDEAAARFGTKRMRYALPLPEDRVANRNPTLETLQAEPDAEAATTAAPARCGDGEPPLQVSAGSDIRFDPVEAEDAREDYSVLTFDGEERAFTENLSYDWYATAGSWQRETSGGPLDFAGNPPPLDSTWTAPSTDQVRRDSDGTGTLDVSIWLVQRDERGGGSVWQTCVRVQE